MFKANDDLLLLKIIELITVRYPNLKILFLICI